MPIALSMFAKRARNHLIKQDSFSDSSYNFEVDTQISNMNLGTRIFLHCLSYGIEGFSLEVHATGYGLEGINRIEVTQHSQTLLQGICWP
jgi:hypothetical protein